MPTATGGGASNIGSANITDGSITLSDMNATARWDSYLKTASTAFLIPNYPYTRAAGVDMGNLVVDTNTNMYCCQLILEAPITPTQFSIMVTTVNTLGNLKISCYTESGLTQMWSEDMGSITTSGVKTKTITTPILMPAGVYYLTAVSVGTANLVLHGWLITDQSATTIATTGVTGKAVPVGIVTVTAGTPAATLTPTTLTAGTAGFLVRLDV